MPNYAWLDYENRIWFGVLIKELSVDAKDARNYVTNFLDIEWLITEFESLKFGFVSKQTVTVTDQITLFKLLSARFETMNFRNLQKLTTKLVNAFVFEYSTNGLSFAQPYCLSILTVPTETPFLDSMAVNINKLNSRRITNYAEQNIR